MGRRIVCLFTIVLCFSILHSYSNDLYFNVYHHFEDDTLGCTVTLKWSDIQDRLQINHLENLRIFDLSFGTTILPVVIDNDKNGNNDYIAFTTDFNNKEPIKTFRLFESSDSVIENTAAVTISEEYSQNNSMDITYLTSNNDLIEKNKAIPSMSDKVLNSIFNIYTEPRGFNMATRGRWNYESGYFFHVAYKYAQLTGDTSHIKYMENWLSLFIDENGDFRDRVYRKDGYRLDDINPGKLVIDMYYETGHEKYLHTLDFLIQHLEEQPKTSDGGYWHKQVYQYQMWLDGIFMADAFAKQYAVKFNKPEHFDEAIKQIFLMYKHAYDSVTGLMYHGWDESKQMPWAHPENGTSPSFWGRGLGWYLMALVDCLDYIPEDHPKRQEVLELFEMLVANTSNYQDTTNGLWYQVLDKGGTEGNWHETSVSAMFAYSYA